MSDAAEFRLGLEAALAAGSSSQADRFTGDGIVICAGGERLFTCAYVQIRVLREVLGCQLPIEVWHMGRVEVDRDMTALLEGLGGIEVVDAGDKYEYGGGWELKAVAIVNSRFRRVLLLDADNMPAVDPTWVFTDDMLDEFGAILWPGVHRVRSDNPIWSAVGIFGRDVRGLDSGQVVVDKAQCWGALQVAGFMNRRSDFTYRHLYGDRDTFLIGFLKTRTFFASVPFLPDVDRYCLYQKGFDGEIAFQHRHNAKWRYRGDNPMIPGFQHEAAAFRFLNDLRSAWSGSVRRT